MNQFEKPPDKTQTTPTVKPAMWLTVGGEVAGLTLIIVFAAVFGGLFLDKLLGTKPMLTITFVLGSAPLALFITYRVALQAVKQYVPPKSSLSAQPGKIYDEEDNSE